MKAIIYTDLANKELNMEKEKTKFIFNRLGTAYIEKDINTFRIHLLKHDQVVHDPVVQLDKQWIQGFNEEKLTRAIQVSAKEE